MSKRCIRMTCTMALAAAILLPGAVRAESASEPDAAARTFMQNAAVGGMAEVQLGKLAQEKASSDAVKQFGARMVQDHGKANAELKTLASKQDVTLPTELDAKHKAEQERLSKLSGAAFDRAYVEAMVEDHQHDVEAFRKAAQSVDDPDVKAFAARTLPTLEEHLTLVKQLQTQVSSRETDAGRTATP